MLCRAMREGRGARDLLNCVLEAGELNLVEVTQAIIALRWVLQPAPRPVVLAP